MHHATNVEILGVRASPGVLNCLDMETEVKKVKRITTKQWKRDLRIWRKMCGRVRIVKVKDQYVVESRRLLGLFKGLSEWKTLNTFSSLKGAINKKNMYIVMVVMRELGYRNEFVKHRIDRKKRLGLI